MTSRHAVATKTPSCRELFGCAREAWLAAFAAYCLGQLRGLHADHRVALLYPGICELLPKAELARGQRDAERWRAACDDVKAPRPDSR